MSVPRRVPPAVAVLLAGLAVAVAPTGPATAAGEGPCTLRPSTRSSPMTEWATCVSAGAELAALPAAGETATLTVEVAAQYARSAVRVEVDLAGGLDWVSQPTGFEVTALASANPADLGRLHRANGTLNLVAGETRRLTGTVRGTATGPARITVRGADPSDEGTPGGHDNVYLTVAAAGGTSTLGYPGRPDGSAVAAPAGTAPSRSRATALRAPKGVRVAAPLAGTACVKGNWGYVDSDGAALRVAPNYTVEVWDKDKLSTDDLLASGETDANGAYHLCFAADDSDGGLGDGGQDVFVLFLSRNDAWRVQETGTGQLYRTQTGVVSNVAVNGTVDFQFLVPADPLHHLAVQAFDAANDVWNWIPGDCWDDLDIPGTCPAKIINWRADAKAGAHYDPNIQEIFLDGPDPSARDVVVHELAHAVMDDVYEFVPVQIPNCANHVISKVTSAGCAWVEGFAEWVPVRVYDDPIFSIADGSFSDLEKPTWGTAFWENGDTVEGRVAGALIDLSDAGTEMPWDKLAEGDANIWHTFLHHKSDTFGQFWAHRTADGFNVANTGGAAALYQNTIDKAFRDPLSSNVPVQRPTPPASNHNFSFNTTTTAWSVVAVRPPVNVDYDLLLFDDASQLAQLSTSAAAASTVDWIAIDSNAGRRPLGDYYPRITPFSGTGSYTVEVAQSSLALVKGSSTQVVMNSSNLVEVRDTLLTANVSATFKVTPSSATMDAELFIVSSTANAPATYIRNRSAALKNATAGGPGAAETITFTPATSGWYGVILVHKSGSGTYTLARL